MPLFYYRSCYRTISVMTCSESCFGLLSECCTVVGTSGGRSCCIVVGTSDGHSCYIVVGMHSGCSYCIVVETYNGRPCCNRSGKCIPIRVGGIKFKLS